MNLAKRIRERRETLELTQEQLARAIGLSPQYISLIEQDKRVPSVSSLARLAEELGVTVDYLITGNEAVISDTIPAIKTDRKLTVEAKRALIATVREFYRSKEGL
jgi:transcriptional regulator with XRE-family HTH domain